MDKDDEFLVPIGPNDIFWRILAVPCGKDGENPIIELRWGWTASMTPEELADLADDVPVGHSSVKTTLDMAKMLRDDLDRLIGEMEGK